jgi:hypothetical protein
VCIAIYWLTGGVPTSIRVKNSPSPKVRGKISADMKMDWVGLKGEEAMVVTGTKCNNIIVINIGTEQWPKWLQAVKSMMITKNRNVFFRGGCCSLEAL